MKTMTGQYECIHSSGVGLDYFTSRIDRLTLQANGRFLLIVQQRSRAAHAAQSLVKGQQTAVTAPETRLEGQYSQHDSLVTLQFDNGGIEQGQLPANSNGLQIGPNFFTKVSDSTLIPSTHRLKQDMDDIAKGLKIASTLGGIAMKAAKTIQGTIQSTQHDTTNQSTSQSTPPFQASPPQQGKPEPISPQISTPQSTNPQAAQSVPGARFCDQCGAPIRQGKRFCNNCGAHLA